MALALCWPQARADVAQLDAERLAWERSASQAAAAWDAEQDQLREQLLEVRAREAHTGRPRRNGRSRRRSREPKYISH